MITNPSKSPSKLTRTLVALLSTTALGCISVQSALAANECGPATSGGTIDCNTSTHNAGQLIVYQVDGLTLNADGITLSDPTFSDDVHAIHLIQPTGITTGDLTINLNDVILETGDSANPGVGGTNSSAVRISNVGSGDANINVTGAATTISTAGFNAPALDAFVEGDGNATITITGNSTLSTLGDRAVGVSATADGNGDATIILGDAATGIGPTISTAGSAAAGVRAFAQGDGAGRVVINGSTLIETTGGRSQGVLVGNNIPSRRSTGFSSIEMNDGTVRASGIRAAGLFVDNSLETDGALITMNGGLIDVDALNTVPALSGDAGLSQTRGIHILHRGQNDAEAIQNGGSIIVNDDVVNFLPTLTPNLGESAGIRVVATGQSNGNARATQNGGSIATFGDDVYGVQAQSERTNSADAFATQGGAGAATITTNGDRAFAVFARATGRNTNDGNAIASQTGGGTLTTNGEEAHGVAAITSNDGDATATQSGAGTILTIGDNAAGLFARTVDDGSGPSTFNGSVIVQQTGAGSITTQGDNAAGAFAQADGLGDALAMQTGAGTILTSGAAADGLRSITVGTGNATALQGGSALISVSGDGSNAISSISAVGSSLVTQSGGTAQASGVGSDGILALGSTDVTVDVSGAVMGGRASANNVINPGEEFGAGIHAAAGEFDFTTGTFTANTNAVNITLNAGSTVGAFSDHAIDVDSGTATISNSGTLTGFVTTFENDDTFTNLSSNSFNARHFEDTDGDLIRDQEAVALSDFGAGVDMFDNAATGTLRLVTVEDQAGLTADTSDDTAPIAWDTTGQYTTSLTAMSRSIEEAGVEQAHFLNLETFVNSGVITLQDAQTGGTGPVWGDVLLISGGDTPGTSGGGVFVSNGGSLFIDTVLNEGGANSQSDILVVDQTQTGAGAVTLFVANAGGLGGDTDTNGNDEVDLGEGILVVEVLDEANSASDAFALGGTVSAGAYNYGLHFEPTGGDWYLFTSGFNPSTAIFENLPNAMLALNSLPTMQQRVGNRYWQGQPSSTGALDATIEGSAIWARFETEHTSVDPSSSTVGSDYDIDIWKIQGGLDGFAFDYSGGRLIAGLNFGYGESSLDFGSDLGSGAIGTEGFAFGATLTWLGDNGFYVDAQAQHSWYDNEMSLIGSTLSFDDADGTGYAFSIETGQRFAYSEKLTLIPQAQLVYSDVFLDAYTGPSGETVSLEDSNSLEGRLGMALEYGNTWRADNGTTSRAAVYGIANLNYEFLDGASVVVSGVNFETEADEFSGEIGLGGSYNWNDDKYSVFGEVRASSSLENFGDSYGVGGNVGFRMKW